MIASVLRLLHSAIIPSLSRISDTMYPKMTVLSLGLLLLIHFTSQVGGFQRRSAYPAISPVRWPTFVTLQDSKHGSPPETLRSRPPSLPPQPDLESISWIAAGQGLLLGLGAVGVSLIPLAHPPIWRLNMEVLFNTGLFVLPMCIGGLLFDRMPGNAPFLVN